MKTKFKFAFFVTCFSGLIGCTGETDPAKAGLFDNLANLNSGEYNRQIAAKDAEANAIIANNRASEQRIASLERQSSANASQISSLRGQIANTRAQATAARSKIGSDPAKISQLNALESQLNGIQSDVNAGSVSSATRTELTRVSAAISALTR
jgi:hypothetical protein